MKRIITLVLLAGAFASSLFAQNADTHVHDKRCGTMHRLEQLKADDPTLEGRMRNIESFTQNWISQNSSNKTSAVVTIPVVVHIVYRTSAENISDAQVQSQIDVLNEDFRRLNADKVNTPSAFAGVAADPEVQFCLAVRDPNGNATSGITRTQTTKTSFSDNDGVKSSGGGGRAPWATDKYLNFWVCNLGGGLLGYAQFPGGPAATDGVVINYNYFGRNGSALSPYQLGRTATHETGHWLNLYHVWGDANCGNDQVSDTPTAADANYGCPTFPHKTCGNTTNGDMFMNYMDYVDDGCMNTFTAGQKSRMQALFATGGARVSILSSQGCVPVNTTCGTPTGMAANSIAQTTATLNWAAVTGATSYNIRYRPVGSSTWTTTTSTTTSKAISGLTAGTNYEFQVQAVCSSGTGSYTSSATFTTLTATQTCSTPANLQTPTIGSTTVTVTWSAVTGAISYNVRIKLKTAVNWSTFNTTGTSLNVSNLTASSTYQVGVQAVCSASLSSAWSTTREFTTTAANACGTDSYEANNSLGAAKALTVNTNGLALICPSTDVDWYRFSNSTTMRNLRITVTNLPADYDLDLYTADGVLLGTSDNAGTTSEGLIYNNAPVAVYYAKVYGYNGAYSNSLSYTVRADISATAFRYAEGAAPANGVIAELANDAPTQSNITLYPNPTQQTLNCNYEAATHGNVKVKVIDLVGKTLLENNFDAKAGVNTLSVDVQNLSNGFYFLELTNGKERIVKKFQTLK